MKMKYLGLLLVLLLTFPSLANAQSPTVTSLKLEIMKQSAPGIVVSTPTSTVICGRDPSSPTASTINPTSAEVDDPATVGKVCKADFTTALSALAADQYIGKAYFVYSDGTTGPVSLPSSPFTIFTYKAPTGLRFVR